MGDVVQLKTGASSLLSPSLADESGQLTDQLCRLSPPPLFSTPSIRIAGDVVPADLRLASSMNFETDEALLTGKSLPVSKDHLAKWTDRTSDTFDARNVGVRDRINMAFASSLVTKGRARGIVVAIGMNVRVASLPHLFSLLLTPHFPSDLRQRSARLRNPSAGRAERLA